MFSSIASRCSGKEPALSSSRGTITDSRERMELTLSNYEVQVTIFSCKVFNSDSTLLREGLDIIKLSSVGQVYTKILILSFMQIVL